MELTFFGCPVCLGPYDVSGRSPRPLSCGHMHCKQCLAALTRTHNSMIIPCPTCDRRSQVVLAEVGFGMARNPDFMNYIFALMAWREENGMVDERMVNRGTTTTGAPLRTANGQAATVPQPTAPVAVVSARVEPAPGVDDARP